MHVGLAKVGITQGIARGLGGRFDNHRVGGRCPLNDYRLLGRTIATTSNQQHRQHSCSPKRL